MRSTIWFAGLLLLGACGAPERTVARTSVRGTAQRSAAAVTAAPKVAIGPAPAQPSPVVVNGPLGRQLDDALSRYAAYGLSGTFLVAHGGDIVLSKGYGPCDRRRGVPCTPDTLFDVGSISKQFTATAIMQLAQAGRLAVSDALGEHLPSISAELGGITIHQLLTHTSGLEDDVGRYPPGDRETFLAQVVDHPRRRYDGSPSFTYSNAGYSLLAEVVRRASGRPYDEYLADMLTRAGLERTRFVSQSQPPPESAAIMYSGAPGQLVEAPRIPWYLRGAGGVHSTGLDLLRWHRALEGDGVLSAQTKARLYETEVGDYAYGWHVRPGRHGKVLWHRGTIFGQQAMLKRYIDADLVVVYVINQRTGWLRLLQDLLDEMIDGVVRELPPLAQEGASPVQTGRYRLPSGATLSLRADGDRYAVVASGDEGFLLMARPKAHDAWSRIARLIADSKGRTKQLLTALEAADEPQVAALLPPGWPVEAGDLLAMWRRTTTATGASKTRPVQWRMLGVLPNTGTVVNVVVALEGSMTTRYLGVAWEGEALRGVGMLSPLVPAAQAVVIDRDHIGWLAKDGTLVRAAQRGRDLGLRWPTGGELVAKASR